MRLDIPRWNKSIFLTFNRKWMQADHLWPCSQWSQTTFMAWGYHTALWLEVTSFLKSQRVYSWMEAAIVTYDLGPQEFRVNNKSEVPAKAYSDHLSRWKPGLGSLSLVDGDLRPQIDSVTSRIVVAFGHYKLRHCLVAKNLSLSDHVVTNDQLRFNSKCWQINKTYLQNLMLSSIFVIILDDIWITKNI